MTIDQLAAILAERVMGWRVTPDCFMTGNRGWKKRKKFQPTARIEQAFQLLEKAAPGEYSMRLDKNGTFWVEVHIGGAVGRAHHVSKPLAITLAVARALKVVL